MHIPKKPTSLDLMPNPFDWIIIPAGKVTLTYTGGYLTQDTTFDVPAFKMAKYPTTNAQFDVFINHPDGYKDSQWWDFSEDAQKWRAENTQPEPKIFDGDAHPRIGVCWYEAVAFCQWLSAITGEKIMLPTEQQWQWAAQGDDGREYPWGNEWGISRCNHSVNNSVGIIGRGDSKLTTPVTQYEGVGDSPFGVVDMAGNVWEWCSTDWIGGGDDLSGINARMLRGGEGIARDVKELRVQYRIRYFPHGRGERLGFRIARL